MKKQEIYVPIANKKEAKRAKAVLKAMGEKCGNNFIKTQYSVNGGLYFNIDHKQWAIAVEFGDKSSGIDNHRTKITLKQLIELLVSEGNDQATSTVEEKISVRVDNEKEFNALMKYYDSLGWKWFSGHNPSEINSPLIYPDFVRAEDKFSHTRTVGYDESKGYKIIPFSEFAKEHGIRVPLLVSEDGVELFEGDLFHEAREDNWSKDKWMYCHNDNWFLEEYSLVVTKPETSKAFSTKQSALDWIEAQKPKTKVVNLKNNLCFIITKDEIKIDYQLKGGCAISITNEQLKEAYKGMEELNK